MIYLLGVNTIDQSGVEAYKDNMFRLLVKPGYEDEAFGEMVPWDKGESGTMN